MNNFPLYLAVGPPTIAVLASLTVSLFRFQGGLQRPIRIVLPQKIGVAHEEALFVIVGIEEPAGYPLRTIAAHFTRRRMEHVNTLDAHLEFSVRCASQFDTPRNTGGAIIAQQLFKYMWQRAVLARNSLAEKHRERFVFLWSDEAQETVTFATLPGDFRPL